MVVCGALLRVCGLENVSVHTTPYAFVCVCLWDYTSLNVLCTSECGRGASVY